MNVVRNLSLDKIEGILELSKKHCRVICTWNDNEIFSCWMSFDRNIYSGLSQVAMWKIAAMGWRCCHGGPVVNTKEIREIREIVMNLMSTHFLRWYNRDSWGKKERIEKRSNEGLILPDISFTSEDTSLNDFWRCPMCCAWRKSQFKDLKISLLLSSYRSFLNPVDFDWLSQLIVSTCQNLPI